MTIMDGGIRLNATLELPDTVHESYPLVIVVHGFTGHMEETHITAVARMFNELGCATLRADMYGHGRSGGSFSGHTLDKWLSNLMTLIDYGASLEHVSDLYLCGHSQGGLTVMLAAAMAPDRVRGIIPMSPAISIPEGARAGMLLGTAFDPERIPAKLTSADGWILDGDYIRAAQGIHVEEAIRGYPGPVLLVHGSDDETIPVKYSIEAQKAYADAELAVIPGETHCYDRHLDQVLDAVRRWMLKQIRQSRKPL